jgi:hypothetical protein
MHATLPLLAATDFPSIRRRRLRFAVSPKGA